MVHRFISGLRLMIHLCPWLARSSVGEVAYLFSITKINDFFFCALVRLLVYLLLKFKFLYLQRLNQSWFCLACKLAILQRFEFVITGELSVLRLSFPRFLSFLIIGLNMYKNEVQS